MPKRLLLLVCAALALGAQTHQPDHPIAAAPSLASFNFTPPDDVAFARLWMDVGMFYPFTGEVSRRQWDVVFFKALNRLTAGEVSLRDAAAEVVGALHDPGSMVLDEGEGVGRASLHLLFEQKPSGLWIIGGSKAQVPAPFGPVGKINQIPLDAFLARRVGLGATLDQRLSALRLATRSASAQVWTFTSISGTELKVTSSPTLPDDLWVEGGWSGVPIHELVRKQLVDSALRSGLDLRSIDWVSQGTGLESETVDALESLRFMVHHQGALFEVKQTRRGYQDGVSATEPYSTITTASLIPLPADPAVPASFPVTLAPRGYLEGDLARILANWGAQSPLNAPAQTTMYYLNKAVQVRLRTSSYTNAVPSPNNSLYGQSMIFTGIRQTPTWGVLSVDSAKALAAASILHWVEHWGFIFPEKQEAAFHAISDLPRKASTVHDLILQASFWLGDPHATAFTLDYRDLAAGEWEDGKQAKTGRLPFVGYSTPEGTLRVLRPASGSPLKPGASVSAINGRPTQDLLREIQVRIPTPKNPFRAVKDLGMLFPYDKPLTLSFQNPGEQARTEPVANTKYNGPWQDEDPAVVRLLESKGWTYVGKQRELREGALLKGLSEGKNYILDYRFLSPLGWAGATSGMKRLRMEDWVREDVAPMTWGHPDSSSHLACLMDVVGPDQTQPAPALRGKVIVLVCGNTQSAMESGARLWQASLGTPCTVAGTATAGITGPVSFMLLPVGGSDRFELFTGTANFPVIDNKPMAPDGVPLDLTFSFKALEDAFKGGATDPYISLLLEHLK